MSTSLSKAESSTSGGALDLRLDEEKIQQELALRAVSASVDRPPDPEIEQRAQAFVESLLNLDPADHTSRDTEKASVETMGRDLQGRAAHRSRMLRQAVSALADQSGEGGPIANALIDLKMKVEELDPNRLDLSAGWFSRVAGMIPWFGTAAKRYFSRFESSQTVLDAIVTSLERGREQLRRDNLTLQDDQNAMRDLTGRLERQIRLAQSIDDRLHNKLEREIAGDDPKAQFLQEEILFPLRQRTIDLQQQLAVNQQGVLATAIVMRNNTELIRGVNRALEVTVSALDVAVSTALALANQKIVLDKVNAINRTTNVLIAGTGKKLRTQGAAIQAQAAGAMLDMRALKGAFADITAALDEISRYRQNALPQMARTILELDAVSAESERRVQQMRNPDQAEPLSLLDA